MYQDFAFFRALRLSHTWASIRPSIGSCSCRSCSCRSCSSSLRMSLKLCSPQAVQMYPSGKHYTDPVLVAFIFVRVDYWSSCNENTAF